MFICSAFTPCPHNIFPSFSELKSVSNFIYRGAGSPRQEAAGLLRPQQLRNWVLCSPEHQHTDPHLSISTGFFRNIPTICAWRPVWYKNTRGKTCPLWNKSERSRVQHPHVMRKYEKMIKCIFQTSL